MLEHSLLDEMDDLNLDLTPLIDVVFILLVFFLLTSTFIRPSIPLDLPQAASGETGSRRTEQLEISIDASGVLFSEGTRIDPDQVQDLLEQNRTRPVSLQVDRAAPFEAVLAVMDPARTLGIEDLSVIVEAAHE